MTVYFALALKTQRIKIGFTRAPVHIRLGALKGVEGEPFCLLATIPGERTEERQWLQKHSAYRIRLGGEARRRAPGGHTEFFRPGKALLDDIERIAERAALPRILELRVRQHGAIYRTHVVRSIGNGARP